SRARPSQTAFPHRIFRIEGRALTDQRKTAMGPAVPSEGTTTMSFTSFNLNPGLLRAVDEMGFKMPTPIQADTIPQALVGTDVLACARTGSGRTVGACAVPGGGRTAASLLRILPRRAGRRGATRALVIAPPRELAAQIDEHRRQLARHVGVGGGSVFGGVGMGPQTELFRRGAELIVATPGRLLDHFRFPYVRLDQLQILVLHQADPMLATGFLPDIRRGLARL